MTNKKTKPAQPGHLTTGELSLKQTPEMIERLKEIGKKAKLNVHQPVQLNWKGK